MSGSSKRDSAQIYKLLNFVDFVRSPLSLKVDIIVCIVTEMVAPIRYSFENY